MSSQHYVVIGLGLSGLSCIEFLIEKGSKMVAMDTRTAPPQLATCQARYPQISIYTGDTWPQSLLNDAKAIVVSPGVSVQHPAILEAKAKGVDIIGDIELFARFNKAPIIAITGSNGKSTVTTIVGEMSIHSGKKTAILGNIGTPALNALSNNASYDLVVMELSSFQLETTHSLKPLVATVLNVTPDHMDRYDTFQDYFDAKHRIFNHAEQAVIHKQDPTSVPSDFPHRKWFFTLEEPNEGEFGLRYKGDEAWLAFGNEYWLSTRELKIMGKHNLANALASLALGWAAGLEKEAMLTALREFKGLPHRCQWVGEKNQIRWFNDSKGTNVGACEAALKGLGEEASGKVVLILGGEGKGADFKTLHPTVARYCRAIIVKGKDAKLILSDLGHSVPSYQVADMTEAVDQAAQLAQSNDIVLLSPACASLDQYRDYVERGEIFMDTVKRKLDLHAP